MLHHYPTNTNSQHHQLQPIGSQSSGSAAPWRPFLPSSLPTTNRTERGDRSVPPRFLQSVFPSPVESKPCDACRLSLLDYQPKKRVEKIRRRLSTFVHAQRGKIGIQLAHAEILKQEKADLTSVVRSFSRHPVFVLNTSRELAYIH